MSGFGRGVDVFVPGVQIATVDAQGQVKRFDGSSFSVAVAVVATAVAPRSNLSNDDIRAALRSSGCLTGAWSSVCQPSTRRMVICPEAINAQNSMAAVSGLGRAHWRGLPGPVMTLSRHHQSSNSPLSDGEQQYSLNQQACTAIR